MQPEYAAKNVVAAGLAEECEVELSYAIGLARPVSIQIETRGTGIIDDSLIAQKVERCFDFRLGGIIKKFNLRLLPSSVKGWLLQETCGLRATWEKRPVFAVGRNGQDRGVASRLIEAVAQFSNLSFRSRHSYPHNISGPVDTSNN